MIKMRHSNFHRALLLLVCLLGLLPLGSARAQTVLAQGDISIIGFTANQAKGFSFVTWVTLANDTEIIFSENGFNNATASSGNVNWQKTYGKWKNTSGAPISAGTVITLIREVASTGSFEIYNAAGATTPVILTLSNTLGGHIFAHQGGTLPTAANAVSTYNGTLLYGLGYQSASGGTSWLTSGPATSGNSVLPSSLVAPNSIFIAGNANAAAYNGTKVGKTIAEYKTLIASSANWTSVTTANSSVTFDAASFAIGTAQTITAHPISVSPCVNNQADFVVTANNATTYQWQEDSGSGFVDIIESNTYRNTTTTNLTIRNTTLTMSGYKYRCKVGGSSPTPAISNAATLTVVGDPVISVQPQDMAIATGSNTVIKATTYHNTTFEWQVNTGNGNFTPITNGGVYSTATTNWLTITGATAAMNGYQYRLKIGGICTPVTPISNTITLTVATAPSITTQPSNKSICIGANTSFSVVAENANTYQWQLHNGSGYNAIIDGGVYSGATTATLNINGATLAMNNGSYRCIVTGNVIPNAVSTVATLKVNGAQSFTVHPAPTTVTMGETVIFGVSSMSTSTFKWQVDTGDGNYTDIVNNGTYSGATTDVLEITEATAAMNGYKYRAVLPGSCPSEVYSNAATLTVNTRPVITMDPNDAIVCAGTNAIFTLTAQYATNYKWQLKNGNSYTDLSDNSTYSGVTTPTLTVVTTMGMNGNKYRCVVSGNAQPDEASIDVLLELEPTAVITTAPTNKSVVAGGNTSFSATVTNAVDYLWEVDEGYGFVSVGNGGVYSGATTSTLVITGATSDMNGYKYRIIAAGYCLPDAISTTATLTVTGVPSITNQPNDANLCAGVTAIFTLTASEATGYQWQRKDGSSYVALDENSTYSGVNTATLTINGSTMAMNNTTYRCVVSGVALPNAISDEVVLYLDPSASITTAPANETVLVGGNVSFTAVTANAVDYFWELDKGDGFEILDNGGVYSGATTATLTISGATTAMNGYRYRLILAGNCLPDATSSAATLTVNNPAPVITAPLEGAVSSSNKPTYAGTAIVGSVVTVYVDGLSIGTVTATAGNWSLMQSSVLADGPHTVYASSKLGANAATADGTTVNFTVLTALSVNLIDFTAKIVDGKTKLTWSTASEQQNERFELARANADKDFSKIASLPGKGTTALRSDYQFVDATPANGLNYYRLMQFDHNGMASEIGLIPLHFSLKGELVSIYPNPATTEVNISFPSGTKSIKLIDINNKVLQKISVEKSATSTQLNVVNLPSGTYLILVEGTTTEVKKLIKL